MLLVLLDLGGYFHGTRRVSRCAVRGGCMSPFRRGLIDDSIIKMRRDGRRWRLWIVPKKRRRNVSKSSNNTASPARSLTQLNPIPQSASVSLLVSSLECLRQFTDATVCIGLSTSPRLLKIQPDKLGKLYDALRTRSLPATLRTSLHFRPNHWNSLLYRWSFTPLAILLYSDDDAGTCLELCVYRCDFGGVWGL
jgi:hypothetical protein